RLSLHQLGGAGDLVGESDLGDLQLPPVGVDLAAQIDHGGEARYADGDVGQPDAPRAPERVGHDDRHVDAGEGSDAVPYTPGRAVGVDRKERGVAVGDVRQVDARVRAHKTVRRLADDELVAAP